MSNPHVTFRDLLGKRIYSVETPAGFVHFVANETFSHESEAVRAIKGTAMQNPVVIAMREERVESFGTELYHPNPKNGVVTFAAPLEAAGIDDGIKPLSDLSYTPESGWGRDDKDAGITGDVSGPEVEE